MGLPAFVSRGIKSLTANVLSAVTHVLTSTSSQPHNLLSNWFGMIFAITTVFYNNVLGFFFNSNKKQAFMTHPVKDIK